MNFKKLYEITKEINSSKGSFSDLNYYELNDYNINELLSNLMPSAILEKVYNGRFNIKDDYFILISVAT